ncbi:acyl-CoA dehydrogenase family protein [Aquabacterium sp. CECT 9606]|uniref:acyl-CoA dehydrogenase family protein n=1 Tax=Aquabacterium sp. CECT 9606 TaxID=2845822 RepID=UPI001E436C09|nr:acyl-CoA dehydrogenase family protein [Aquabacterium sp. CECT 9606]CAH0354439.1 Acyl-CoA dehydrogenase [Aquabacterium sp. CECT 9606]
MDFDFNDDQEQLRDAVRKWVSKDFDFERRRGIVKAGGQQGGYSKEVWQSLADLGLLGLAVPGDHGGMEMGPIEAMVVMEELGRGLVLAPYAAVALMGVAVLRDHVPVAVQAQWLPQIAEGRARLTLAYQERAARYRLGHVTTTAQAQGETWVLNGVKSLVPVGDLDDGVAEAYIVPARVTGAVDDHAGIGLFLVERGAPGLRVQPHPTQDGGRAAELTLTQAASTMLVPALSQGAHPLGGHAVLEHATDIGIAALCAEAVGAMEQLLAITVDYMNTRKQFGVAIASFQALRHRVADMKMQLELARSMSYYASLKLTAPAEERRRAISQAKVQLGQSMRFVGQQAVQLHGGIGVTDEYNAGHYFKRLTVIELTLGDTLHHLGEVSQRMQDTAGVFA